MFHLNIASPTFSPSLLVHVKCSFMIIYFQNINPRMKFWGVVAEVNKKDLVISLPGGLRGLVSAADAFDPILGKEIEVGFAHISQGVVLHQTVIVCYGNGLNTEPFKFFLTRIQSMICFLSCSMLGNWFHVLCCKWMMTRKNQGRERSGFHYVYLYCTKTSHWTFFKKEWYINLNSLISTLFLALHLLQYSYSLFFYLKNKRNILTVQY